MARPTRLQFPAFTFPASLVKVAGDIAPPVLLAIYLGIALVAGEFEWGTVRTLGSERSVGAARSRSGPP